MSAVVAIVVVLVAGWLVGGRVAGVRSARYRYTSNRARAAQGFSDMVHNLFTATFGIAGLAVLLFLLVFVLQVR